MRVKPNEAGVHYLQEEIKKHKAEKSMLRSDIDGLRGQNIMLMDTLDALTQDESYWSAEALQTGIVFKLKNVLNQIRQDRK
jgi:hypothetical protein